MSVFHSGNIPCKRTLEGGRRRLCVPCALRSSRRTFGSLKRFWAIILSPPTARKKTLRGTRSTPIGTLRPLCCLLPSRASWLSDHRTLEGPKIGNPLNFVPPPFSKGHTQKSIPICILCLSTVYFLICHTE